VTRHTPHPHRLAFPALLLGNAALSFGPWMVRLADVGPVAAGFWRVTIALPFLWAVARASGQRPHWPSRRLVTAILIAAIFYVVDLATWNAGIRLTKLGNATLFGNTGSFVFAVYGLWLAHRLPSGKQAAAMLLAVGGAALLMSGSYELSPRNFAGDLLTLVAGLLYGGYLVFTPDDDNDLPKAPCNGIWSSDGGDVTIISQSGNSSTFTVPAGSVLPCRAYRVMATGTTSTSLVALY